MTASRNRGFVRSGFLSVSVATLFCVSCGGDAPADDVADREPNQEEVFSDGSGTLELSGGTATFPGTYDLLVNCNFFGGRLTMTAFPEELMDEGPGATSFMASEPASAFTERSHSGRYDVGESQGDGRILNYFGVAEISVTGIERNDAGFASADFEVEGHGDDGLRVNFSAHCLVVGA